MKGVGLGSATAKHPTTTTWIRCPNCDYTLIGLPRRVCPECGERFWVAPDRGRDRTWWLWILVLGAGFWSVSALTDVGIELLGWNSTRPSPRRGPYVLPMTGRWRNRSGANAARGPSTTPLRDAGRAGCHTWFPHPSAAIAGERSPGSCSWRSGFGSRRSCLDSSR